MYLIMSNETFLFLKEHYLFFSFLFIVVLIILCATVDSIVERISNAFSGQTKDKNESKTTQDK